MYRAKPDGEPCRLSGKPCPEAIYVTLRRVFPPAGAVQARQRARRARPRHRRRAAGKPHVCTCPLTACCRRGLHACTAACLRSPLHPRDPLIMSSAHLRCDGRTQALNQPGNTSCIKVIVERCEGLVPAGGSTLTIKPYVHYRWAGTADSGYRDVGRTGDATRLPAIARTSTLWCTATWSHRVITAAYGPCRAHA